MAFKGARYFSPAKIHELRPSVSDIDCLRVFPFLDSEQVIDALKTELPVYLAAVDVSTDVNPVQWWKHHATDLPKWSEAFRLIILVQPSSFSVLQSFKSLGGLRGTVELSVMLQYNNRSLNICMYICMNAIMLWSKV